MSWLRPSSGPRPFLRDPRYLLYALLVMIPFVPLALSVDGNEVSSFEESVFHAVNDLPAFLYNPLWPFMQLGNLLVIPAAALVALALRRFRLAAGILALGGLKLWLEEVVKGWVFRERPASVISDVVLRGDTPSSGQAFVSGHAVLIVGIVTLAYPYLSVRWRITGGVLAFLVCFGRVYSGAHFPADVIGGAAVGFAVGCILNFALGTPGRPRMFSN